MKEGRKQKLLEQIEKWNDADELPDALRLSKPSQNGSGDYLLTLKLGRAYSNLAVLGVTAVLLARTLKWMEIFSGTPLICWSPSAPRVRTIPTGMPGWATPA